MSKKSALFAFDEDSSALELIVGAGEKADYAVHATSEAAELLERITDVDPAVIIVDLPATGADGAEILRSLADKRIEASIILTSELDEEALASAEAFGIAHGLNVFATMQKPLAAEDLGAEFEALRSASAELSPLDLEKAMDDEQFVVHYLPAISRHADGGWRVAAMEALLRWQHPLKGLVYPENFVGMAEECGMSRALTEFVIRRSAQDLEGWRAAGLEPGLRINIPAALIADSEFPDRLEATLKAHAIDPACITLELTETATLRLDTEVFDTMMRLRVKNVNLAIDDFGVGYSSLTQLFAMPFSEMKIDNALVGQIPESKEASIMVSALVDLAHKLNLTVCAEGVETEEALNFLANIGCDDAQGFFVSYPIPAQDVRTVIDAWEHHDDTAVPGEQSALA